MEVDRGHIGRPGGTAPARARVRATPRDVVIEAGRERLLTHGIDALRSQLNASVLSGVAAVSRDTAYRVFRDDPDHPNVADAIAAAVSRAAHDPAWGANHDTIRSTMAAELGETLDRDAAVATVKAALQANFDAQFSSPSTPVTWLLQVAAFTGSPAWKGEPPPPDCAELASELLDHGRASYTVMTTRLVNIMGIVMSALGRRPRGGMTPETIVALLHALHDGAVLRGMIDPDALSPELVAEAMYRLAEAFTEEGSFADPRRPEDPRHQRLFDHLLAAAASLWRSDPDVTVDAAAALADVSPEASSLLFPTVGDLADSLIRARVIGGGFVDLGPFPDDAEVGERLLGLIAALRNLRAFADELPHAVVVTRACPPTRSASFAADFVLNESRVVAALDTAQDPTQIVQDLVTFASQGSRGWPVVRALLRSLGHELDG